MTRPVDHLAAAKGIMSRDSEDLGDHELAEVTAHALIVAAENLAAIADILETHTIAVSQQR